MSTLRRLMRLLPCLASLVAADGAWSDGSQVVQWGKRAVRPESLLKYTQVACGLYHTYALKDDGTVIGWGENSLGQIGTPASLPDVVQIACEWQTTYALRSDGTLVGWGNNAQGQTATPSGLVDVKQVDCGYDHTYARKGNGTLVGWGFNNWGQINTPAGLAGVVQVACAASSTQALKSDGTVVGWGYPMPAPAALSSVSRIDCGASHAYALKADGTLVGWGLNDFRQTTTPASAIGIKQVACGLRFTYGVRHDGTALGWGYNGNGQTNTPAGLSEVDEIRCGGYHTYALMKDGSLRTWGDNIASQGDTPADLTDITQVACGVEHYYGIRSDGTLVGWGSNNEGQLDTPSGLAGVTRVACGKFHTYALREDRTLVGWGYNGDGQINTPPGLADVTQVACGFSHTIALKGDGSLAGWGYNGLGQASIPPDVGHVVEVTCGSSHTYARRSDGTLLGWGFSGSGRIATPADLDNVAQVACGGGHTYARRSDGVLVGWGYNDAGQTNTPANLAQVVQVACGESHTCALKSDGAVVCWGQSSYGRTQVPANLPRIVQVACSGESTVALLAPAFGSCDNVAGAGTATVKVSGSSWRQVEAWGWSSGAAIQVPGALTHASLGLYGSVGSECAAQAATLTARSGTSLLVTAAASKEGNDHSIRVGGAANLAGRLWLLGVDGAGETLPVDLDIAVLSAGTVNGYFELIQSELPPPPGYFLTLVPQDVDGRTVFSLRMLPLLGNAGLAGATAGSFSGRAVAAETIDIDHDGFDDLALAVDFGSGQPGLIQILLNDGAGNLGATSVVQAVPAQPTCLAVGDEDGDGRDDVVVGIASDQTVRVYRDDGAGGLTPGGVISGLGANPLSVVVLPSGGASMRPGSASVGVGVSGGKLKIFQNGSLQQEVTMAGTVQTVRGGDTGGRSGTDIVTGGKKSSTLTLMPGLETGFVQVLRRQASGLFAVVQTMEITAEPVGMDVADLDGDGLDDIVTANANPVLAASGGALPVLSIFRNTGGTFGGGVAYQPAGASSAVGVSLVDADSDGDRDIVSVHRKIGTDSEAALLRVDTLGAGTPISIGQTTVLGAENPILAARGNLDGAGGEDLFLVDTGSGAALTAGGSVKPYLGLGVTRAADLDGSGVVDFGDVTLLMLEFGPCPGCRSDLDGSGVVDFGDVNLVMLDFG